MLFRRSQEGAAFLSSGASHLGVDARAFTLVELMAACAVLVLLVVLLGSTLTNFTKLTSSSSKRMETDKQARSVFDLLSFDLDAAITDGGMSLQFFKNHMAENGNTSVTKNDSIVFLARAKSELSTARMAIIGYDVDKTKNPVDNALYSSVLRHVQPFAWTDDATGPVSLSSAALNQALASGVFRMELAFLKDDALGTIVADPPTTTNSYPIKAVICSLATLDEATLASLSDKQKDDLVAALPDAQDGVPPLSQWELGLSSIASLPRPVVQNIRFHQRYFYLK